VDLGTLTTGGSTSTELRRLPAAGQEDWFLVRYPESPDYRRHGTGQPRISFGTNEGNEFRFDLQPACGGSVFGCGSGGGASGLVSWSFVDTGCAGSTGCSTRAVAWPNAVLVRVFRAAGGSSCSRYRLVLSR
jgi:hypothetical protein